MFSNGRTPRHAKAAFDGPRNPSAAMQKGTAIHFLLLWPDQFSKAFALAPSQEKRSNKDKAAWAAMQAQFPDATILRPSEWDDVHRMRDRLLENGLVKRLLAGKGRVELTIVWKDEPTGLLCKARLDRLISHYVSPWDGNEWPAILDLKTTKDARRKQFSDSIVNFNYDIQCAHYMAGANSISAIERKYVFIAIENVFPFCSRVFEAESAMVDVGTKRWRRCLNLLAKCYETGAWPGYPEEADTIGLPEWVYRMEENQG